MLIELESTAVMSAVPAPPIAEQAAAPPKKHAFTICCALKPPVPPGVIASCMSISYQSIEKRRRSNEKTAPSVDVSAVSGFRFGLPPDVLRNASGALPFHGLLTAFGKPPIVAGTVERGRNSSRNPAARTSCERVARKRSQS